MNELGIRISVVAICIAVGACAKTVEWDEEGSADSTGGHSAAATGGSSSSAGGSSPGAGGASTSAGGGTSAAVGGSTATSTASCADGVKNGTERGVDCGPDCEVTQCEIGATCLTAIDCANDVPCVDGVCSLCSDGLLSAGETDVDCGGAVCAGCAEGQACLVSSDCVTRSCDGVSCGAPGTCLLAKLAECPCEPPNQSSIPKCEAIIECYIDNSCDPSTCSTSGEDTCGSNTLQVDSEPMAAAEAVYACACG